jgi:hypothetical protein
MAVTARTPRDRCYPTGAADGARHSVYVWVGHAGTPSQATAQCIASTGAAFPPATCSSVEISLSPSCWVGPNHIVRELASSFSRVPPDPNNAKDEAPVSGEAVESVKDVAAQLLLPSQSLWQLP